MFALTLPTAAHVRTFNLRTEKHGDEDVTAMDLGMRLTGSSALLDMLHPGLRGMLYLPPDTTQEAIPGETNPWSVLRCDAAHPVTIKYELVGRNIVLEPSAEVESALRGDDALQLGSCDVNQFKVTAKAGGSVDIDFRIQTNDIDAAAIGQAGAMLAQDVKLSVTHTEVPEAPPVGDTSPKEGAKTATDLFVEGGPKDGGAAERRAEDAKGSGDPAWPFPTGTGQKLREQDRPGAPPAHLAEGMTKGEKAAAKRADKASAAKAH